MAHSRPAAAPEPVTTRKSPEASRSASRASGLDATSAARRKRREALFRIEPMLLGVGLTGGAPVVGVYRLWRDTGFVVGALLAGAVAICSGWSPRS